MAVNVGTTDSGITNDINAILTERRDIPFGDAIAELEPDVAPLTALLMKMAKRPVDEAEFRWFEEDPLNRWLTLTTGFNAAATTISVGDVSGIYPDDILRASWYNTTTSTLVEELLRVTAVNRSTNQVTVGRGYGPTNAQDFSGASSASPLQITVLGNLSQEGASPPEDRNHQPVVLRNVTGITRTPFSITQSLDASRQRANPQERARLQRYWGREHRKSIEQMILFGEMNEDLSAGAPRRMTGGVVRFIQTNVFDMAQNMTLPDFYDIAEEVFRYGDSGEKWVFASATFMTRVANMYADRLRLDQSETQLGVRYNRIVTPHGEFRLVLHRMLRGPVWGRAAIILDLSSANGEPLVQYRPQRGRDTKLRLNIHNPGDDLYRDEYLTEAGVQVKLERLHGLIINV